MLTLDTIMKDSLWVARMTYGYRFVGTYEEAKRWAEDEECKDFDLCANQPEHLEEFYTAYFTYSRSRWITVQDFYNNIWSIR